MPEKCGLNGSDCVGHDSIFRWTMLEKCIILDPLDTVGLYLLLQLLLMLIEPRQL
jgi:hypothetical protein